MMLRRLWTALLAGRTRGGPRRGSLSLIVAVESSGAGPLVVDLDAAGLVPLRVVGTAPPRYGPDTSFRLILLGPDSPIRAAKKCSPRHRRPARLRLWGSVPVELLERVRREARGSIPSRGNTLVDAEQATAFRRNARGANVLTEVNIAVGIEHSALEL